MTDPLKLYLVEGKLYNISRTQICGKIHFEGFGGGEMFCLTEEWECSRVGEPWIAREGQFEWGSIKKLLRIEDIPELPDYTNVTNQHDVMKETDAPPDHDLSPMSLEFPNSHIKSTIFNQKILDEAKPLGVVEIKAGKELEKMCLDFIFSPDDENDKEIKGKRLEDEDDVGGSGIGEGFGHKKSNTSLE